MVFLLLFRYIHSTAPTLTVTWEQAKLYQRNWKASLWKRVRRKGAAKPFRMAFPSPAGPQNQTSAAAVR